MYPILLDLGPVIIRTKSLFALLAFLTTAFVYWRKTREEHYQQEQAFDAFLLSSLVGLVFGRIGFVLSNFGELGRNVFTWLDVVNHPGSLELIGLLAASVYMYRFAGKKKWDQFEILDFWLLAVAAGMVLKQLGNFFAGVGFGYETNLPWGIIFPGVFAKHHPVQLYSALFYLVLYIYLYWAEFNYRTFVWYRAGKKTAQTGFLTAIFLIATGLFTALIQIITPAQLVLSAWRLDYLVYGGLSLWGIILLYKKSGRRLFAKKKRA